MVLSWVWWESLQKGQHVCACGRVRVCGHTRVCAKRERNDLIPANLWDFIFQTSNDFTRKEKGKKKKSMMDFSLISHRKSIISGCVVWLAKYLRHTKTPLVEISEMIYCSPSSEIRSRYARRQTQTFTDLSLRVNGCMYVPPLIIPAQVTQHTENRTVSVAICTQTTHTQSKLYFIRDY